MRSLQNGQITISIKASRETIDTVMKLLTDQLHLAAVKDQLLLEENIMKIACICEEVAFKSGFQMCIDLFNGKLLKEGLHND